MISTELFSFAFIPAWFEQLYELSQMAAPESWRFIDNDNETQNTETPILERYINQIFRKQAIEYNCASSDVADKVFYIRNEFACFHTGLYTPKYKSIYMCFERNKKRDTLKQWYFKGFVDDSSDMLKYVQPLPQKPIFPIGQGITLYNPDWEIRVNTEHILGDAANIYRLPPSIRDAWNLPLLLETAVEMARRKVRLDWSLVVPQVFQNHFQYLLPIYLTRMDKPDLAMALEVMDGYYVGHTCLTLQMAYQNARLLARPSAGWLTALVEHERSYNA